MGRAIAIEPVGVTWRQGPLGRPRLLAFDDALRIEGTAILGANGEHVVAAPELLERVRSILAGPTLAGDAFAAHVAGPHGSRIAARTLIAAAESLAATDVHVEPLGDGAAVRFRREGVLAEWSRITSDAATRLVAALKGLAGCLPYRSDVVQEGRIARTGVGADIRASFVPAALGDRVALRLFGRMRRLEDLGLDDALLARLRELLSARTGLVLVAGSTGAGKTTTLYAALAHLATTREGAHLSLEDPVEQRLRVAGIPVDQVELDPGRGRTGEAMLAAALRQDVDVLAVGEIRSASEAALAVQAAHTGRLVLAGVHAGSCDEARVRLLDLGVDGKTLAATLRGVLHQELVIERCECASSCARCDGLGRRRRLSARLALAGASRLEVAA